MPTDPAEAAPQNSAATHPDRETRGLSRRAFTGAAAAASGMALIGSWATAVPAAASMGRRVPHGFGSVSTAPHLPPGFTDTFTSQIVEANGLRQHIVIGGEGPPLLLVHGWPENWYAWRFLMPVLAQDFTVIAVDQRGIGLTDKPVDGFDSATLAQDLVALMDSLGYGRFAVVGHDTGYIIAYALAADHRDRIDRLVVAEIPGPPGVGDDPSLFVPDFVNDRLWHIPFNRVNDELIIDMVRTHADAFYRYEYAIQGGGSTLPEHAIKYYVRLYTRDKNVLRASFGLYRAWQATYAQNKDRASHPLTIPVLGIGGARSWGSLPGDNLKPVANDVQTIVMDSGHWVAEQAPEEMLTALSVFLEPYRASAT